MSRIVPRSAALSCNPRPAHPVTESISRQSPTGFASLVSWRALGWSTVLLTLLFSGLRPAFGQLPSGWSDQDIGFPSQPGSASYSGGNWSVSGGGSDIWNTADNFHFASEGSTDNAILIARVTTVQYTDPWAKAGVMLRDSAD